MAVSIIDQLETIQVEHEDGGPLGLTDMAQAFIKLFGEEATVRQPGQRVMPR
jgi:hypothetical protein